MKRSHPIVCFFAAALFVAFVPAPARAEKQRHFGRTTVQVSRGIKIHVDNRTTGRITVKAWDRDAVEAHAVSSRGDEVVIVGIEEDTTGKLIWFKADYANYESSDRTEYLPDPPQVDDSNLKVHLEVNVPKYVEIALIEVFRSDVQVTGVETLVAVRSERSSVILNNVGSAEVRNRSGNVEIDGVTDLAAVATTSGAIRVANSKNMVRAISIGGPIEIRCSSGRVDVANTEAPIELVNIDGDVDAVATNSHVRYTGKLRADGRYYLKSMSGRVEMLLPQNSTGFNATLSSYQGAVESDFNLTTKQPESNAAHNRRRSGIYGNGSSQIILDSFEGLVRLTRVTSLPGCG